MISYIDGSYRGTAADKTAMTDTNIPNMAAFIEVDTGKLYFYDADNTQWVEFTASGSSSGGDTLASASEVDEG